MRRRDRGVKDIYRIREIIWECGRYRPTFLHGESTYIVPFSFGYNEEENTFYFHGAAEGKKMDLVRQTGHTGFETDITYSLKGASRICGHPPRYRNAVGEGPIWVVEEVKGEKKDLNCIMGRISGKDDWVYPEAMFERTAVLRLDVEQISGKGQF